MGKLILPTPIPRSPMYVNGIMTNDWQNFFWELYNRVGTGGPSVLTHNIDSLTHVSTSKPTLVRRGVNRGFSFPIYAADNEELFVNSIVSNRWDGVSDITLNLLASLSAAEDVGDTFSFQVSWDRISPDNAVSNGAIDVEVETTIVVGGSAAWSTYLVPFTIDYTSAGRKILVGDMLSWRIRRIASSVEVANEIIIWR